MVLKIVVGTSVRMARNQDPRGRDVDTRQRGMVAEGLVFFPPRKEARGCCGKKAILFGRYGMIR
jgi:hypothetical protein